MDQALERLVNYSRDKYGGNLLGILQYGSSITTETFNDYDVILILKNKVDILSDLSIAKIIKNTFSGAAYIDLQIVYENEIDNPNLLSLDSHGCFISKVLENASLLYGVNPFCSSAPNARFVRRDVVAKIQYYVFRARQLFLGYQVGAKDKSNDFHKKKIILAMQDVLFFNGVYSKDDVINRFKKHHPETLTNNDYLMLTGRDNDITKYLPIYENIYSLVLTLAKERPLVPQKPFWWKYNDMFVEYLLPKGKIRGAIVLCDGLPSIPYQRELMNELLFTDYAVFFPRYRGTWESGGEFLKESPIKDIKSLSLALINGIEINKIDFKTEQIVLIGTSFGGAVALSLANESEVKKVIALSPVIDFVGVPSVRSLGNFLQSTFTGAYRFENKNWHFLATGQLMNPINDVEKKNGKKIHIFAGKQDEDVSPKSLLDFCLSVGAFYHLKEKCAHISFSKIDGILLDDIKNMI